MRSVLAWILTSPARLALVAALVVGIALSAALLGSGVRRHNHSAISVSSTAPGTSDGASSGSNDPLTRDPAPAERAVSADSTRPTVNQFLAVYLATPTKKQLHSLRPIVTDQLWAGLRLADPTSLPAGPATRVTPTSLGAYAATYDVTTASAALSISVVLEPDGWKVNDVEPADAGATP